MDRKSIIFHIPWKLRDNINSASQIRPRMMLKGFKELGFDVHIVMGDVEERKRQIKEITEKINNGFDFLFCYSESSVGPTLITGGYRTFLRKGSPDFRFLRKLKKNNIPVGLFYRDIYWKMNGYTYDKSFFKAFLFKTLYRYDLWMYKKVLDTIFLPSLIMGNYLGKTPYVKYPLPSGCDITKCVEKKKSEIPTLFYVGGIGRHYELDTIITTLSHYKDKVRFYLCVRENEWKKYFDELNLSIPENVVIFHETGESMLKLYEDVTIGSLFLKPEEFRDFAMPYKLFEYIEQGLPILASKNTEAGRYVEDNNLGWTIPYTEKALEKWLIGLLEDNAGFDMICANIEKFRAENTWQMRCRTIEECLVEKH